VITISVTYIHPGKEDLMSIPMVSSVNYFPKGSSFENIIFERIQEVEDKLNHRPRKTLG